MKTEVLGVYRIEALYAVQVRYTYTEKSSDDTVVVAKFSDGSFLRVTGLLNSELHFAPLDPEIYPAVLAQLEKAA